MSLNAKAAMKTMRVVAMCPICKRGYVWVPAGGGACLWCNSRLNPAARGLAGVLAGVPAGVPAGVLAGVPASVPASVPAGVPAGVTAR